MSMYPHRFVTSLYVTAALCITISSANGQSRERLVWSDEFNKGTINRDVWTYDIGGHGFGNGQLEFNTNRRQNSYVKDGKLVIEARREAFHGRQFTSARMHTQGRFAFQYGTLAARIQVPDTANGIWPAFWMLGDNFPAIVWPKCGEVDILEIGGKEGIRRGLQHQRINCALHYAASNGQKASLVAWHNAAKPLHRGFHIYKVSWTPKSMRFFLDNREIGKWDISGPAFREFHQPFFPILNVAVGSRTASYTGLETPQKITAQFPAKMKVDWLRLYANSHTKGFLKRRPVPAGGFGVFTEDKKIAARLQLTDHNTKGFAYGSKAALLHWNNLRRVKQAAPWEGSECWTLQTSAGQWFGFGVLAPRHRNLQAYAGGSLTFAIKSRSTAHMKVGIKSSSGEVWVKLGKKEDKFGFARDGQWQRVRIPLSKLKTDLRTIHQPFMLAGDPPAEAVRLAIDDVRWEAAQVQSKK